MKVVMLALGSYGDLIPYTALGRRLKKAGHEVVVFTSENYEPLIRRFGLSLHSFPGDAETAIKEAGASMHNMVLASRNLSRGFAQDYGRLAGLMEGAAALLNQLPGGVFGYELSAVFEVPMALVAVIPLARTGAFPLVGMPLLPGSPAGYNRLTYRVGEQLAWQLMRPIVNRWRVAELGQPPAGFWGPMHAIYSRPVPILNGFSPQVIPRPHDWGEHVKVTGYWFPDDPAWRPPETLVRFIESGKPPVFIGFGSMPVEDPPRTLTMIAEALDLCGRKAVVGTGWGLTERFTPPENVYPLRYAPYDWLFPRMAAVIHHGGSGTTGFALAAGVPTLAVPFVFDQFFWGKRIAALGVGPPPIPFRKLSSAGLAAAIDRLVADSGMLGRAQQLGGRIREEAGLDRAVLEIERLASAGILH